MTREEEIKQAVESNLDVSFYTPQDGELLKETFYIGAKWADENPQSPWISVKDRLPTKGGHYLCMDDNHNISVLAFVGDKWINTKTFTDVPLEVVIYWMSIPPLPKE